MTHRLRPHRIRSASVLVVLVTLAALLAAGCSRESAEKASAPEVGGEGAVAPAGEPAARKTGRPPGDTRALVHTAQLDLRVDDVARAGREAGRIAERAGGFVADQQDDLAGEPSASLTLKVPPDQFRKVLAALDGLGRVDARKIQVEDVTEQVVDLDARLKTAATSVERLRSLLAQAKDVSAVVALEAELSKREELLESLEGQRRVLQNQVDLATVDVDLAERTRPRASGRIPGVGEGLRSGWAALVNVLKVLVLVLAVCLPFVPLVVLAVWGVRRLVRRRPRRPPRPRQPAGWPPPGAPGPWATPGGPAEQAPAAPAEPPTEPEPAPDE